jgi:hypothetical protein
VIASLRAEDHDAAVCVSHREKPPHHGSATDRNSWRWGRHPGGLRGGASASPAGSMPPQPWRQGPSAGRWSHVTSPAVAPCAKAAVGSRGRPCRQQQTPMELTAAAGTGDGTDGILRWLARDSDRSHCWRRCLCPAPNRTRSHWAALGLALGSIFMPPAGPG